MKKLIHIFRQGITLSVVSVCLISPAQAADNTLYEQIGGMSALENISKGMLTYSLEDDRVKHIFDNSNIERLQKLLTVHVCEIADGPCEYEGQHMRRAHHGLGIETKHFNAVVENMQKAMDDEGIPFSVQNKLLARLAPFHGDVTGRTPIPPRTP